MENRKKVCIVEDDQRIREMLKVLINGSDAFTCSGAFPDAKSAVMRIPVLKPELVLMDINLPGMNGVECVKALKKEMPELIIIMLTLYEEGDYVFESLKAGAVGYLVKMTPPHEIISALHEALKGGSPMTAHIARKVVQSFQPGKAANKENEEISSLTPREIEILELLSEGYQYKEIAAELFISPNTVHNHLRNIYEKLQVRSKTEAVVRFLK